MYVNFSQRGKTRKNVYTFRSLLQFHEIFFNITYCKNFITLVGSDSGFGGGESN